MAGESPTPADSGPTDPEGPPAAEGRATEPWQRRAVLVPAAAVVVLFVSGLVVANLPGEGMHPMASLFVGIVWSLATLIVVAAVLGVVITWLLRTLRG